MTAPMAPVPAPPPVPAAPAPPAPPQVVPGQDQQQQQAPQDQTNEGGQSATDAAANDPSAWQAAAEMDARFDVVQRSMNGQIG